MTGLPGLVVILCLLQYSDAQITGWTITTGTIGTNGASPSGSVTEPIPETKAPGDTLFTAVATGVATTGTPYTITDGNTGTVMEISSAGVVKLAAGKSLDFETTDRYTLKITALAGTGSTTGTLTLIVNIKNVLEFGQAKYDVCMADGATADTTVGTYTVKDNTASTTLTYAISSGNTNSDFAISTSTGVLKVATGKMLAQKTIDKYTVVLGVTESGAAADAGSTTLTITVGTCGCSSLAATLGLTLVAMVVAVSA